MAAAQLRRRDWLRTPITMVGHPFAAIGMGEQIRTHTAALRAGGADPQIYDVYRFSERNDPEYAILVGNSETEHVGNGIRIFHINGDEVDGVLSVLEARGQRFSDGYNIVFPAWELPRYPAVWVPKLKMFDEIWAGSWFVHSALAAAGLESHYVGQSIELPYGPFLPRKFFGIRESAFVVLNFFDLSSYEQRKNPEAVLALMSRILEIEQFREDYRNIEFVLKVKDGVKDADEWAGRILQQYPNVHIISTLLSAFEAHSLINCCDCFVSLHRAEGFGHGIGEAMYLGRLAMATGWSGNLDYMTDENSLLIKSTLVPVATGAYPHGDGQVWAEPDVEHAARLLARAISDENWASSISRKGRASVRLRICHRAIGVRCVSRLVDIAENLSRGEAGIRVD